MQGVAPTYSACSQGGDNAKVRWMVLLNTNDDAPATKSKVQSPLCDKFTAPSAPERSHSNNCSGEFHKALNVNMREVAERQGVMAGAAKCMDQLLRHVVSWMCSRPFS